MSARVNVLRVIAPRPMVTGNVSAAAGVFAFTFFAFVFGGG
jgi:hypothetical protein